LQLPMIKDTPKGPELAVKVVPKSSRNSLAGWENGELKVRLNAVPEKGSANKELIDFLSEILNIPKSHIILTHGKTSRHKRLLIQGTTKQGLGNTLQALLKDK